MRFALSGLEHRGKVFVGLAHGTPDVTFDRKVRVCDYTSRRLGGITQLRRSTPQEKRPIDSSMAPAGARQRFVGVTALYVASLGERHRSRVEADRLVVALDVYSLDEALRAVDALDNVSFFKVGLQLLMTGGLPTLLESLRGKRVFVDLKLPGDISNTIGAVIDMCVAQRVAFLTLSESMPPAAIRAAAAARNAHGSSELKLLTVPFLSSLDAGDSLRDDGSADELRNLHPPAREAAIDRGSADGIIASRRRHRVVSKRFPHPTIVVSPGIRPDGAAAGDQKRHTTPPPPSNPAPTIS
jgi:orotidine-5'-phosphate decarboxylase